MLKKRLMLNIIANFFAISISLGISFYLTPIIVENIGIEAYSFVPISTNFITYIQILTTALTSMAARFITIKIHKNDNQSAIEYYSTSFYLNILLTIFCSIICIVVVTNLDKILNIPINILLDVKLLFVFMFLSFLLSLSTGIFAIPAFCMNRLDISSLISVITSFFRVIVIFLLFRYFKAKVFYIGVSTLVIYIILFISNYYVSKKITPQLKIHFKNVKLKIVKELFSAGIWNSFNQFGFILFTGLDLLIANLALGASEAGVLAIAKTAPMALQSFINIVPIAFNPFLTIVFAKENRKEFMRELQFAIKINAIITGIPIAGFISLTAVFLKLWIPNVANIQLTTLTLLTMISMVVSFSIMPLVYIFTITNKLKWPSILVFIAGLLNVIIVFILLKTTNFGIYAIAAVSSVIELLRSLIFIPIYASKCLHEKKSVFYSVVLRSLVYITILIAAYSSIVIILQVHSWKMIIFTIGIMSIVGLGVSYFFMLNKSEKNKVKQTIVGTIKRRFKQS